MSEVFFHSWPRSARQVTSIRQVTLDQNDMLIHALPRTVAVFLVGLSCSLGTSVASAQATETEQPVVKTNWQLVWSDEFEQDGRPDPAKWRYEFGFVRNQELQWYQPENARCARGLLIIEARRERLKNPSYDAASRDWKRNREVAEFTSACLHTRGLQQWKFGRFEMRARIDTRSGLWPAFWTLGTARERPGCGEIDIMEYYRGTLLANACWASGRRWQPQWDDSRTPIEKLGGEDWSRQFHVWRMDWDENSIRLYVDDRLLNTIDLSETMNNDRQRANPFLEPQYLLLNLSVGGTNGGDPAMTEFPAWFDVDYVRVYQRRVERREP